MELDLGLKITQTRDDISSMTDLRIAKDGGGIIFLSRETENMFILTAHLKGYRKEDIDININEDGTCMTITGNKAVQEKVMLGWILFKKDVELRGFKKTFKIPEGVVLDKIRAKFDEDRAVLTVFMPKMVQEVSGHVTKEVEELENDQGGMTNEEETVSEALSTNSEDNQSGDLSQEETRDKKNEVPREYPGDKKISDVSKPKKRKKICIPVIAGSTVLVSLILLVIHMIRAKR